MLPAQLLVSRATDGRSRVYVDRSKIIQSFMREGLIGEMTVRVVPVLIGSGKRMFGELRADVDLQLVAASPVPSGLLTTKNHNS